MPKGYSLHIGVNEVDLNHYQKITTLRGAVNDAVDLEKIAREKFGYTTHAIFKNQTATSTNVLEAFTKLSQILQAGDILLVTYSGHGSLIKDPFYEEKNEEEVMDQTWCLYDRQLIDDEIFEAFSKFRAGLRILVISDSCHSGSVTREILPQGENEITSEIMRPEDPQAQKMMEEFDLLVRELPLKTSTKIHEKNFETIYKPIQKRMIDLPDKDSIGAAVKLFSACQDMQVAFDGKKNGRFTTVLKKILDGAHWKEINSPEALIEVLEKAFYYPRPNYYPYGAVIPAFENNFPFLIETL